jgi:DNA-binding transcriptional LysR family regulator
MFSGSLRAFDEVARLKSIRKASDALGVAPSSVSRHVANLERQMGTALLDRRRNGVELTHAGNLIADYVRRTLLEYDGLRADLNEIRGMERQLIRLAAVESIASLAAMDAVCKVTRAHPSLAFNIRLLPAPMVIDAVKSGQCELGLAYCAHPDPHIVKLASIAEPIVLAVNRHDPLANSGPLTIADLSKLKLAMPDKEFGIRGIIDDAAAAVGVRLEPVLSANDFEILRAFVRSGPGAALLPMRAVLRSGESDLSAVQLSVEPFLNATIDLVILRERRPSKLLRAFAKALTIEIGGGEA